MRCFKRSPMPMRRGRSARMLMRGLAGGVLVGGVVVAGMAPAGQGDGLEAGIDAALQAIQVQASAILSPIEGQPLPAWLGQANARADIFAPDARALAERAGGIVESELGACAVRTHAADWVDGQRAPITLTLFASRSLGKAQLRDLFLLAAGQRETQILFRGIGEEESLLDFMASLAPLLANIQPPPTVLIDPTAFRAFHIQSVPTLVATAPDGRELARVSGLVRAHWLRDALEEGKRGDLGVRGPIRAIAELDLLELIHQRLARLDFKRLGERAVERAFDRLVFETLPTASEERTRWIDPTLTAPADIHLPDGRLLVGAGESINPLEKLPFTQRLVVFDASDSRQLAWAETLARAPAQKPTTYLLTGLQRAGGWDELTGVMERLERRVFLLTPEIRQRFALTRVPALVEALGRQFRVQEIALSDDIAAATTEEGKP